MRFASNVVIICLMAIIMVFTAVVMFAADPVQVRKVGCTSLSRLGEGKEVSPIALSRRVMSREVYSCGVAPSVCIPCDHIALAYVESSSLDHWQAVRVAEQEIDQSMINQYERVTTPFARVMSPNQIMCFTRASLTMLQTTIFEISNPYEQVGSHAARSLSGKCIAAGRCIIRR